MNNVFLIFIIILLTFTAYGCSFVSSRNTSHNAGYYSGDGNLKDLKKTKQMLYEQYYQWEGTKFKYGGLNKKGIDCSGLVYITYRDKFGIKIPRTTRLLAKFGTKVKKNRLQPGDLVFFKIGFKGRHVGIYMENNKFMHTSKQKGVMISKLDDYYWKDKYWQSRRVQY